MIPRHGGLRYCQVFRGFRIPSQIIYAFSSLGVSLIGEMNRLGVLVDLSHTSDATATQALNHSKAPVIWSHSSARAVHDVPRNVPDDVLRLVGTEPGQKDAVVMVNLPLIIAVMLSCARWITEPASHTSWRCTVPRNGTCSSATCIDYENLFFTRS